MYALIFWENFSKINILHTIHKRLFHELSFVSSCFFMDDLKLFITTVFVDVYFMYLVIIRNKSYRGLCRYRWKYESNGNINERR